VDECQCATGKAATHHGLGAAQIMASPSLGERDASFSIGPDGISGVWN